MKKLFFLFSCLFILLNYACDDDDQIGNPFELCCNLPFEQFTLDTIKIYIPNAFSPNADGFNDRFLVQTKGTSLIRLDSFWITDLGGNLLFELVDSRPDDRSEGWDGMLGPNQPYLGMFHFGVKLSTWDGQSVSTFEGEACSIPCGDATAAFDMGHVLDCIWSAQHDGRGSFDPRLGIGEDDCL